MANGSSSTMSVLSPPDFPCTPLPRVSAPVLEGPWNVIDGTCPVVISPEAGAMSSGRRLTPENLRLAFGGASVTVTVSQDGAFRYQPGSRAGSSAAARRMPFSDFATYVENAGTDGERLYLSQFPLGPTSLDLGSDVAGPPPLPDGSLLESTNLWFGPAGTVSPLHFDRSHNFLHQHWGRKHIVLVDPAYSSLLRAGEKNSESPHVSSLDLVAPGPTVDLTRLSAPSFEAVLEPGDVLFLPAFWWHNVMSLDAAISVNYWWKPPIADCLHPNFFRMLSSRAVYDNPSVVTRWVDVAPRAVDTGLCLWLVNEGHTFGAAALAGALVTAFCTRVVRSLGLADSPTGPGVADALPGFSQAVAVIPALRAQGVIDGSQSDLLLEWLELAEETAADPEPRSCSPERTTAIREMVQRLHVDFGGWLSA